MIFGPLAFTAPWVLLGLIVLPQLLQRLPKLITLRVKVWCL